MDTPRTKLEVLHHMVLGEAHEIIKKLEAVKADFPRATNEVGDALGQQTGNLLAAAEKLRDGAGELEEKVNRYIGAAVQKEVEASSVDVKKLVCDELRAAVGTVVGDDVRAAVGQINTATTRLAGTAGQAEAAINAAAEAATGSPWLRVAGMAGAGAAGALIMSITIWITGGLNKSPPLSAADQQALIEGRLMARVWPRLTKQEQDRFNQLANSIQ